MYSTKVTLSIDFPDPLFVTGVDLSARSSKIPLK